MYIDAKKKKKKLSKLLVTKFNSTLKRLKAMMKWDLSQACKDDSVSTHQ